ncbi:hypothetical protein QTO34_011419, partial [Cnephaeus nilssonii]
MTSCKQAVFDCNHLGEGLVFSKSGSPQVREATWRSGEGDTLSHLCCCHCWQRKPRLALGGWAAATQGLPAPQAGRGAEGIGGLRRQAPATPAGLRGLGTAIFEGSQIARERFSDDAPQNQAPSSLVPDASPENHSCQGVERNMAGISDVALAVGVSGGAAGPKESGTMRGRKRDRELETSISRLLHIPYWGFARNQVPGRRRGPRPGGRADAAQEQRTGGDNPFLAAAAHCSRPSPGRPASSPGRRRRRSPRWSEQQLLSAPSPRGRRHRRGSHRHRRRRRRRCHRRFRLCPRPPGPGRRHRQCACGPPPAAAEAARAAGAILLVGLLFFLLLLLLRPSSSPSSSSGSRARPGDWAGTRARPHLPGRGQRRAGPEEGVVDGGRGQRRRGGRGWVALSHCPPTPDGEAGDAHRPEPERDAPEPENWSQVHPARPPAPPRPASRWPDSD